MDDDLRPFLDELARLLAADYLKDKVQSCESQDKKDEGKA